MFLIIAEKPSLGRNIAAALGATDKGDGFLIGGGYIVTWAFGHLFSLCDIEDYSDVEGENTRWTLDNLPCFPERFRFRLRGTQKAKKKNKPARKSVGTKQAFGDDGIPAQFARIEALCRRDDVEAIVNAGDADREGEIIVRLILEHALAEKPGFPAVEKPLYRLWLPDQTVTTIRRAAASWESESHYDNLANEGLARTYVDWLYGVNLTRYATIRCGTLLRVGRVIVPIVRAVYERDMEIRQFTARPYLCLQSKEKTHGQILDLTSKHEFDSDEAGIAAAEAMCIRYNAGKAHVTSLKKKTEVILPGKLYSLSALQNVLGKKYKMTMEKSLSILQKLYEDGYVTYPRTNSEYLASAEKEKISDILNRVRAMGYPVTFKDSKRIFDDSKIESHSALTPTYKIPKKEKLTEDESKVYSTIFRRFAAVFCETDCTAEKTEAEITLSENGDVLEVFKLRGTVIVEEGWMKYDDAPKKHKTLPKLETGECVKVHFAPVERETKPPEHYTIETLNNYLKNPFKEDKSSKKRALAALGITDDEEDADDTEDYRAIFEGLELGTEATRTGIINNAITSGYIQLKKGVYTILPDGEFLVQSLDRMEIKMDKYKTSTLGRALKRVYRGEDTVEECVSIAQQEIREIFEKMDKTTVTRTPYQPTKGKNNKKKGPGGQERHGPLIRVGACPLCGCDVVRGQFAWGCMGYRNGCSFRLSATILSHTFTPEEVAQFLTTGQTPLITDFISKNNKRFSAYLYRSGAEVKFAFDGSNAVREDSGEHLPPPDEPPPIQ